MSLKPFPSCSGTFHSISHPRKPTGPKDLAAPGTSVGQAKCCHLVDIFCNYNLITSAHRHLSSQGLVIQLIVSCPQEMPWGRYWRNIFQNQPTLRESTAKGKLFSHPLKKKKQTKKQNQTSATRQDAQHP